MPGGRPTKFTKEIAERICDLIATTPRGLDHICDGTEELPSSRTVHRWIEQNEEFCRNYLRARELQADLLFDECLSIADDTSNDTKVIAHGENVTEAANTEWISRSKLRVDTRMRMAGKLNPKKYGDKLELNATVKTGTEVILPHVTG